MTDIEKVNEEIRNYKLFKIQRALTRQQEFTALKNKISKTKKLEFLYYSLVCVNIISISVLIYSLIKCSTDYVYLQQNTFLMLSCFIICVVLSLFFSYRTIKNIHLIKSLDKTASNAAEYFKVESENLKSIYENYIDNYLEKIK